MSLIAILTAMTAIVAISPDHIPFQIFSTSAKYLIPVHTPSAHTANQNICITELPLGCLRSP